MESKICFVSVLDVVGSTNLSMAYYFAKHNFGIIPVNYRTIIQNNGYQFFEDHLRYVQKVMKPEITVFSKCNGINPDIVAECSKYSKTWLFNMDPISTIKKCPEVIEHAKNSHFSSCTGKDIVEYFKDKGVENCYHVIQGTDPDIFRPVEPVEEYKATISFIGSKTSERDMYKEFLEDFCGVDNVKFYGPGYEKEKIDLEFARVCASSRFMLSVDSSEDVHTEYFSNRLVRYLSCGVCTIHLDRSGTLDKYFKNGEEILYIKNEEDLRSVLSTVKEQDGKIALAGREKVLSIFTWDHTIAKILDIINNG